MKNLVSYTFIIPYAFQSQDSQGGREKICVTEKKSGKNPEVLKSALAVLTPEVCYLSAEEAWKRRPPG